ncbi:hypothetical protein [Actinokineospora sp.]|uniref:hypothetical protein n=1 Tax=Actinokineospora sp. TaxID=1872133 RepID=UPI003D6B9262
MRKTVRIAAALAFAAVAALFVAPTATASPATTQSLETTFFSGTVAAGASQTWKWNNANPLSVSYVVGLSPKGASTTQRCEFEVTRTWYQQNFGGEREFWYTIKNVGAIACGTDVMLYSMANSIGAWSTGGVNAGQSVTKHWNNANPLNAAYVVGMSPEGATSTSPCKFEVTRTWYQQQPGGEREFWFTLKNIGTIACSADILMATKTTTTVSGTGTMGAGTTGLWWWNNANPLSAAYIVGYSPQGATGSACQFELFRSWYSQVINSNGAAEREFRYTAGNVGSIACSANRLLATA